MAGVPVLSAVLASSSLAVDLAVETVLTPVGFLAGPDMNVYAGELRIALGAAASHGRPRAIGRWGAPPAPAGPGSSPVLASHDVERSEDK